MQALFLILMFFQAPALASIDNCTRIFREAIFERVNGAVLQDPHHIVGLYQLATLHLMGVGTPVNEKKAFKLFEKSALKGYPPAQYELGNMYLDGVGTTQSAKKALYWYGKSVEKKYLPAQHKLSRLYAMGEKGIPVDLKKSKKLQEEVRKQSSKEESH